MAAPLPLNCVLFINLQCLIITCPDTSDSTTPCPAECWKAQSCIVMLDELQNKIAGWARLPAVPHPTHVMPSIVQL